MVFFTTVSYKPKFIDWIISQICNYIWKNDNPINIQLLQSNCKQKVTRSVKS